MQAAGSVLHQAAALEVVRRLDVNIRQRGHPEVADICFGGLQRLVGEKHPGDARAVGRYMVAAPFVQIEFEEVFGNVAFGCALGVLVTVGVSE